MPAEVDPDPSKLRKGWFFRGFRDRYCHGFLRKHFHAVRRSRESAAIPDDTLPIIVALNHPSWWDPLICTLLSREFGDREHYGVMDAEMLSRYGFFRWLGVYGVEGSSLRGAARFLRITTKLLSGTNRVFWITAQGRFADVRDRPIRLESGVGYVAAKLPDGWILPLAIEYTFWNEKTPEVLLAFGDAIRIGENTALNGSEWTQRIEDALRLTMDRLTEAVKKRDPKLFVAIVGGRAGTGGVYGLWQRIKSWSRLRKYQPKHDETDIGV